MKKSMFELARVVRSKNAGPYELTLDIIFKNEEDFNIVKEKNLINKTSIAEVYHIKEGEIENIIYFDPALAVKILLPRRIVSGSPGDSDVYGAQQHAPLLKLEFDI
ncbi:MAG: DUF4387 domain-containing protein [Spirochaetales bacterium]|nr:DUF4387 domain-containing protein [Spirochaetales bacterium]